MRNHFNPIFQQSNEIEAALGKKCSRNISCLKRAWCNFRLSTQLSLKFLYGLNTYQFEMLFAVFCDLIHL